MHKLEVTKLLQNAVTHLQKRGWSVSCDFRAVYSARALMLSVCF